MIPLDTYRQTCSSRQKKKESTVTSYRNRPKRLASQFASLFLAASIAFGAMAVQPQPAIADWPVIDLTAVNHLISEYNLLNQQYATMKSQLATVQNVYTQLSGLGSNLSPSKWAQLQSYITTLSKIPTVMNGFATTDAAAAKQFTSLFPTYAAGTTFNGYYTTWQNNTSSAIQSAIAEVKAEMADITTQNSNLADIANTNPNTVEGLLQQSKNVAAMEIQQGQKLEKLMGANMQANAAYYQQEMNSAQMKQQLARQEQINFVLQNLRAHNPNATAADAESFLEQAEQSEGSASPSPVSSPAS